MRRIARCRGEFEPPHDHRAIDPQQAQLKPPCAFTPRLKRARHVFSKIAQHPVEQRAVAQRFHQAALHQRHLLRDHRQQRFGHAAE